MGVLGGLLWPSVGVCIHARARNSRNLISKKQGLKEEGRNKEGIFQSEHLKEREQGAFMDGVKEEPKKVSKPLEQRIKSFASRLKKDFGEEVQKNPITLQSPCCWDAQGCVAQTAARTETKSRGEAGGRDLR